MLFWKRNGEIDRHELYQVGTNPTEEGNDLASDQPSKADAMQTKLLRYLKSVDADEPKAKQPKKRTRS
jgi:hypothetical protein